MVTTIMMITVKIVIVSVMVIFVYLRADSDGHVATFTGGVKGVMRGVRALSECVVIVLRSVGEQ
jgi:hypothetical protein